MWLFVYNAAAAICAFVISTTARKLAETEWRCERPFIETRWTSPTWVHVSVFLGNHPASISVYVEMGANIKEHWQTVCLGRVSAVAYFVLQPLAKILNCHWYQTFSATELINLPLGRNLCGKCLKPVTI